MKNKSLLAFFLIFLGLILPAYAAPPDPNTNTGNNTSGAGGYSGVVSSGQTNNVAYYPATGTTVFGNKLMLINNGALTLGQSGTAAGSIGLSGMTGGIVVIAAPSAVTSYTLTLPSNPGLNGYVLTTDGTGITSWQNSGGGGSGGTILPGSAGQMAWYATTSSTISGNANVTASGGRLTLGQSGSIGQIILNGFTSGTATIQVPAVAGTTTFQLPPDTGTNGYVLTTDGTGVTTWQAASGGLPTPQLPVLGFLQTDGTTPTWEAPWNNNSGDYILNGSTPPLIVHAANITMSSDTVFNPGTTLLATGTIDLTNTLFGAEQGYAGGSTDANQVSYQGGGPTPGYLPVAAGGHSNGAGGNGGGSYGQGGAGGFNIYSTIGSSNCIASIDATSGSGGSAGQVQSTYTSLGGSGEGRLRLLAVGAITFDGAVDSDGNIRNDAAFGQTATEFTDITIGGSVTTGDTITLIFNNGDLPGNPVSIPYTTIGGDTTTTIATALTSAINASLDLPHASITATSTANVIHVVSADYANPTGLSFSLSGGATETVTIGTTVDNAAGGGGGGGGVTEVMSQTSISYINGASTSAEGGQGGTSFDYGGGGGGGGGLEVLVAPVISGANLNENGGCGGLGASGGCGAGGEDGTNEQIVQVPTLPFISLLERDLPFMVAMNDAQHITRGIKGRSYRWSGSAAIDYLASINAKDFADYQRLCYELNAANSIFSAEASTHQEGTVSLVGTGDAVRAPSSGCSAPGPYDQLYLGAYCH